MLTTPGTPADAYGRMSAAWGHGMVGACLASAVLILTRLQPKWAFAAAVLVYLPWELWQIAFEGSDTGDLAIDAGCVAAGAAIVVASHLKGSLRPAILSIGIAVMAYLGTRSGRAKR